MKFLFFMIAAIGASISGNAQPYRVSADKDGSKMYTGFISDDLMKGDSAFKWFDATQRIYKPKKQVVKTFAANKDSVNFVIFMGTWCEDSHFVIPRFFKILDTAAFDKERVTLIAVDRSKKDITNLATTFNITNVPTIIVFKNGKEIGRVVEYGTTGKYDEEVAALLTNPL
jgi:thiol-disulfide isomerase/thioredoxin